MTEQEDSAAEQYTDYEPPWRNEEILRELYCDKKLSLRETADRLNCSKETVRQWLDRHDIETRRANDQKVEPCYHVNEDGYAYFLVTYEGEQYRVGVHELCAIQAGADPHQVFGDETHCHHRLRVPSSLNPPYHVETPANVEVLDRSEHTSRHARGEVETPSIEAILSRED